MMVNCCLLFVVRKRNLEFEILNLKSEIWNLESGI